MSVNIFDCLCEYVCVCVLFELLSMSFMFSKLLWEYVDKEEASEGLALTFFRSVTLQTTALITTTITAS